MNGVLTPKRRRGFEHLDDPSTDARVRERSHRDIVVANRLFGGTNAVLSELQRIFPSLGARASLLDVGTGLADIPERAQRLASRKGISLATFGLDGVESLARTAAARLTGSACGDARLLPFATASVDVVVCSQVLHHFEEQDIVTILSELDRVARVAVIVSDLRRSWLAAAGFWLATWPLSFHPISRHDGTTSVLRGFTGPELSDNVHRVTGQAAHVRRHLGYRLTATWMPVR